MRVWRFETVDAEEYRISTVLGARRVGEAAAIET